MPEIEELVLKGKSFLESSDFEKALGVFEQALLLDPKNPDLWKEYIEVAKGHKINATWVRGHAGHRENEICDKIAKEEAEKLQ